MITDIAMVFVLGRAECFSSADISSEGDAEVIANSRAVMDEKRALVLGRCCTHAIDLQREETEFSCAYYFNSKVA